MADNIYGNNHFVYYNVNISNVDSGSENVNMKLQILYCTVIPMGFLYDGTSWYEIKSQILVNSSIKKIVS